VREDQLRSKYDKTKANSNADLEWMLKSEHATNKHVLREQLKDEKNLINNLITPTQIEKLIQKEFGYSVRYNSAQFKKLRDQIAVLKKAQNE